MKNFLTTFYLFTLLLILCIDLPGKAQSASPAKDTASFPYWTTMMQDPNANFHSVQSAFRKYWAHRTDYRHNGWKVFRRWEYINETRVMPDGKLPPQTLSGTHILKP
jgi:hypothetical protein